MNFQDKLKTIKGLICLYQGAEVRTIEVYDNGTSFVRVLKDQSYTVQNGSMILTFVSDGNDAIVVSTKDLMPRHR